MSPSQRALEFLAECRRQGHHLAEGEWTRQRLRHIERKMDKAIETKKNEPKTRRRKK